MMNPLDLKMDVITSDVIAGFVVRQRYAGMQVPMDGYFT
jgi:hypothetical protein